MRLKLAFLWLLVLPALARGLATEQLGNGPLNQSFGLAPDVVEIASMDSRVYWYEVNANPTFFFKGDARELRKAIAKFAALQHPHKEIILLAGAGETTTLTREKKIPFDWSFHVPHGLRFRGDSEVADTRATLTIRVAAARGKPPEAPADLAKWVTELNEDNFKKRALAEQKIEALGTGALPALRKALAANPPAEARGRLERLLDRAGRTISIDVLEIPPELTVIGHETLLKRSRTEMNNKQAQVRGHAISSLPAEQMTPEELLKEYETCLASETHEYPLRCAIGGASVMGSAAKSLLPRLREIMKSEDKNVQNACNSAIKAIEKAGDAKAPPAPEIVLIRKEIGEFVAARKTK